MGRADQPRRPLTSELEQELELRGHNVEFAGQNGTDDHWECVNDGCFRRVCIAGDGRGVGSALERPCGLVVPVRRGDRDA